MKKKLQWIEAHQSLLIVVACVLMLILICTPLLVISKYNYPAGDDLGYSAKTHLLVQRGESGKIVQAAIKEAYNTYFSWQGSYTAIFLMALQPGIFGEQYYCLGTWILLGSLLLFSLAFWRRLAGSNKEGGLAAVGVWAFLSAVCVLFVPYPNETFYWYNGSVYYTFYFALELLLFSEICLLLTRELSKGKRNVHFCVALLLLVFIGGGNLATGMLVSVTMTLLAIVSVMLKHKNKWMLVVLNVLGVAAYLVNVVSPGNAVRQAGTIAERPSVVGTVLTALWHTFLNVISWTKDVKILLVMLFVIPFLYQIVKGMKYSFRLPGMVTVLLFGVYASQLAPISYANGSYGPCRMGNITWYSYILFLALLEGYWIGWFYNKKFRITQFAGIKSFGQKYYGVVQIGCLALWCVCVLLGDYKALSTYQAVRCIRNGEAAAYAAEMEHRLSYLHDDSIADVYFESIVHRTEPLFYCDISPDNTDYFNISMAEYYGKNSVKLIGN